MRPRTGVVSAGIAVAALFALTACSGANAGADSGGTSADTSSSSAGDSSDMKAVAPESVAGEVAQQTDILTDRSEIVTADVTLVDKDPGRVRDRIDSLLAGSGGMVTDEATYNRSASSTRESHLTVRLPTAQLDALIRDFRSFTTVKESHKTSKDVTTQVIDVDSRVKSKQAALDRLRTFLTQTTNVDTLIKIEAEVSNREAELESLLAQQKQLAGQVAMATLTIDLSVPPIAKPKPSEAGFADGLANGWDAFQASAKVAATGIGAVLPFAVLFGVIGAGAWIVRRQIRSQA